MATAIGQHPTDEMYATGLDIDCQCARCGSSVHSEPCGECEDGYAGHDCGEDCCACRYPEPTVSCDYCGGTGTWHTCCSSPEWCDANPMHGREGVERGELEWYTIEEGAG